MNRIEAGVLLTYIARVDHRTWGPDDAEAFADLLDDVSLADATFAAREHLREDNAWLTPALIRRRVLDARRQLAGPNWCGLCDERTRLRLDPESLKPTGRCPICHPLMPKASAS